MSLKTDFKDDILDSSKNTKRKYNMIENEDGTISLDDVTEYSQIGDEFGSGQINETNRQINEKIDTAKIVRKAEDINAITESGFVPDALAFKETMGGFSFKVENGKKKVSTDGGETWENFSGGLDLLWTNPNPTSAFPAQTLSIDLSGYESVVIQAKGWSPTVTYTPLKILVPKDGNQYIIAGNQHNYTESGNIDSVSAYMRLVTVNNDGITFTIGKTSGSATNAQACIPLEIYGCGISLE